MVESWTRLRGFGQEGRGAEVIDHLNDLSVHQHIAPYNFAVIYAGLNKDDSFVWLIALFRNALIY